MERHSWFFSNSSTKLERFCDEFAISEWGVCQCLCVVPSRSWKHSQNSPHAAHGGEVSSAQVQHRRQVVQARRFGCNDKPGCDSKQSRMKSKGPRCDLVPGETLNVRTALSNSTATFPFFEGNRFQFAGYFLRVQEFRELVFGHICQNSPLF